MWRWQLCGAAFFFACHTLVSGCGSFADFCIATGLETKTLICGRLLFLNYTASPTFSPQKEEIELQCCDPGNRSASDVGW